MYIGDTCRTRRTTCLRGGRQRNRRTDGRFCQNISVTLHLAHGHGRTTRARNSRGITAKEGISADEVVTKLCPAGRQFDSGAYRCTEAAGVGVSVVNVPPPERGDRDQTRRKISAAIHRGAPEAPLARSGTRRDGTKVLQPDAEICERVDSASTFWRSACAISPPE